MTIEKNKLAVNQDGLLVETGVKEISVDKYDKLLQVDYEPKNGWIILQPLSSKERKTDSGIIIPGSIADKQEFRAAVVAVDQDSKYKRGQVVRIDPTMFGPKGPEVEYICNLPLAECPEHFVKGIYTNVDLSDWK